jgi:hypothetical protein
MGARLGTQEEEGIRWESSEWYRVSWPDGHREIGKQNTGQGLLAVGYSDWEIARDSIKASRRSKVVFVVAS